MHDKISVQKKIMKKINLKKFKLRIFKHLPAHEKRITIPTVFTFIRFILSFVIVGTMIVGYWGSAFVLFILAASTDLIDGSLARILNEKTFLGACLDPLADKMLLLSVFCTLAFVDTPLFQIPQWFFAFVLGKEIMQVTGAVIVYSIKGQIDVRSTILGKITTVVQVGFIVWLFACYFFKWLPIKTYYTMLGVVIIMVFASLVQYVSIGIQALGSEE